MKTVGALWAAALLLVGFVYASPAQAGPYAPDFEWTEVAQNAGPEARSSGAMAFHPGTGKVVLFGGSSSSQDDTWTWDGATWTEEDPPTRPTGRSNARLAYDPNSGDLILVGGATLTGTLFKETWAWDGETWTQKADMPKALVARQASSSFEGSHFSHLSQQRGNSLQFGIKFGELFQVLTKDLSVEARPAYTDLLPGASFRS